MAQTKGDGSELCCIVNPARRHTACGFTLCLEHGWNNNRQRLGLGNLSTDLKLDKGCPRCGKVASPEQYWDRHIWPEP